MKNLLTKSLILLAGLLFLLSSCEKLDLKEEVPACVKKQIRKLKREKVRNPPAEVWKWVVDGKTYYYVPPYCCDMMSILYDDNCGKVCSPDGGFTGKGDGKCPDFEGQIERTLIWEDDREYNAGVSHKPQLRNS